MSKIDNYLFLEENCSRGFVGLHGRSFCEGFMAFEKGLSLKGMHIYNTPDYNDEEASVSCWSSEFDALQSATYISF